MSTEVMKQALEALEQSRVFVTSREKIKHPEGTDWYDKAITTLRQAIAEAEKQEPVGWFGYSPAHDAWFHTNEGEDDSIPLYKYPPKREWVGLTDEEIQELHYQVKVKGMGVYRTEDIYRAVEAKLKEKNT